MTIQKIEQILVKLEDWFDINGLAGFDPYDVKGLPKILFTQRYRYTRAVLNIILEGFPHATRRFLGVKPTINPKGVALLTNAYINRYEISGSQDYLHSAEQAAGWLINHGHDWSPEVVGWGYPFHWQSRILIPKGVPSSVVTAFGLQALLALESLMPGKVATEYFNDIGRFFSKSLNRSPDGCFSYTPIDYFKVHNANLFSVWSLLEITKVTGNDNFKDRAIPGLEYTINQQGERGEFGYWGDESEHPIIDNFHSGYVIRLLARIQKHLPDHDLQPIILKAVNFYLENFLKDDLPRDQLNRPYPVNIHTLAEVILIYCELPDIRNSMEHVIYKVVSFLDDVMQFKPGQFGYKYYPRQRYLVKIPFFRWNQAWIYLALTSLQRVMT